MVSDSDTFIVCALVVGQTWVANFVKKVTGRKGIALSSHKEAKKTKTKNALKTRGPFSRSSSGFHSMKRRGVLPLLPGWEASPS